MYSGEACECPVAKHRRFEWPTHGILALEGPTMEILVSVERRIERNLRDGSAQQGQAFQWLRQELEGLSLECLAFGCLASEYLPMGNLVFPNQTIQVPASLNQWPVQLDANHLIRMASSVARRPKLPTEVQMHSNYMRSTGYSARSTGYSVSCTTTMEWLLRTKTVRHTLESEFAMMPDWLHNLAEKLAVIARILDNLCCTNAPTPNLAIMNIETLWQRDNGNLRMAQRQPFR